MSWHLFRWFFLFLLCFCHERIHSKEFLYPVAAIEREGAQPFLFLIHQTSLDKLELLFWNPETDKSSKILSSRWTPAGFKLLHGNTGVSFIDNGRIRVKRFEKRSPKSIDIYDSLRNFGSIEWIDQDCFYTSAQKGNNYGIFQIDQQGGVQVIVSNKGFDSLYPQRVGKELFYIERRRNYTTTVILKAKWPQTQKKKLSGNIHAQLAALIQQNKPEQKSLIKKDDAERIYDAGSSNIMFLRMISPDEGFFVEHPGSIVEDELVIKFSYHRIKKEKGIWEHSRLFYFSLPTGLVAPPSLSRLHESILPLLPHHCGDAIYFSSCIEVKSTTLDLMCYSLKTGNFKQITHAQPGEQFFAPVAVGDRIFYGGNVKALLQL